MEAQVVVEGYRIDRAVCSSRGQQGGDSGRKAKPVTDVSKVERLDAQAIATEDDAPSRCDLDDREGEHPDQVLDKPFGSPVAVRRQDDLGIRFGAKALAGGEQLGAQLPVVVDAAVEDDGQASFLVDHGLRGGVREIDDLQTPMDEADALVKPAAVAIRSTRGERGRHTLQRRDIRPTAA